MGFFSALFGCGKQDEASDPQVQLNETIQQQASGAREVLAQLRQAGVTDQMERKLEYFFYTNTETNASDLAAALAGKGYAGAYGPADEQSGLFLVTGWTTDILMSDSVVIDWSAEMCRLAFDHDCQFDGWGTYTEESGGPELPWSEMTLKEVKRDELNEQ
ncbi:MAG: ribonuclease E inhibitor RraB [Candidatus Zixiibacteriota bacterium]